MLVETSGLVHWTGHPKDRNLLKDMNDLAREKLLFETEDWHDDPFKPIGDQEEIELAKELDSKQRKQKDLLDLLTEVSEKLNFVKKAMLDPSSIVDSAKTTEENKASTLYAGLKEECKAEGIQRAYMVVESEVRADIADDVLERNP